MRLSGKSFSENWQYWLAEIAPRRPFFWIVLAGIFLAVLIGHQSLEVIDRDEARFAQQANAVKRRPDNALFYG
jgi:hypothetical protein